MRLHLTRLLCLLLGVTSFTQGALVVYSDKTGFLSATGAVDATPSLTGFSGTGVSLSIDGVVFSSPLGQQLRVLDWTPMLPGNDIAVDDSEDFDVTLPGLIFSLGFDIVEPSGSPSSFTATLFNGTTSVGSFVFDPPDGLAAFVGVWATEPFNRLELRETTAINQDEYLGHFYSGTVPQAVPEPSSVFSAITGFGAMIYWALLKRRRNSV